MGLGSAYRHMATTEIAQNLKQIHDGPYISLMRASARFLGALPATVVAAALILPAALPTAAVAATPPAATARRRQRSVETRTAPRPAATPTTRPISATRSPRWPRPATTSTMTTPSFDHQEVRSIRPPRPLPSSPPAATSKSMRSSTRGQVWLKMDLGNDANSQLGISGSDQWMSARARRSSAPTTICRSTSDAVGPDRHEAASSPQRPTPSGRRHHVSPATLDLTAVSGHNTPDPDEVAQAGVAATTHRSR